MPKRVHYASLTPVEDVHSVNECNPVKETDKKVKAGPPAAHQDITAPFHNGVPGSVPQQLMWNVGRTLGAHLQSPTRLSAASDARARLPIPKLLVMNLDRRATLKMAIWGNNVCETGIDASGVRRICSWLFITADNQKFTSYQRIYEKSFVDEELYQDRTWYGTDAGRVDPSKLRMSRAEKHELPVMDSWTRSWDAVLGMEIWRFRSEKANFEYYAEVRMGRGGCCDSEPREWRRECNE